MVNLDRLLPFAEPGAKAMLIAAAFNAPLAYLVCFAKFVSFRSLDFAPQLMLAAGVAILMTGVGVIFDLMIHAAFARRVRYPFMTVTALVLPSAFAAWLFVRISLHISLLLDVCIGLGGLFLVVMVGFMPSVIGRVDKTEKESGTEESENERNKDNV